MPKHGKDDVGYGKPPSHTKYKPGQSGNPRGRPRRSIFDDGEHAFEEELLKSLTVTVDGRKKKVHPMTLIAKRIVKDSIDGNFKAINLYKQLTDFQFASKSEKAKRRLCTRRLLEQFFKDGESLKFEK
jgi:hypothetical protein